MGVIRPPWIDKEWFSKCPFNYCDHFGNKPMLAKICKICRDDVLEGFYQLKEENAAGEMPYRYKNSSRDLKQILNIVEKQVKKMGLDMKIIQANDFQEAPKDVLPIIHAVHSYGKRIEKAINEIDFFPEDADGELIMNAIDIFSHSRHYIIVKTSRAIDSRFDMYGIEDELQDSKTAAFFAYVAVERNSHAFLVLAQHQPLHDMKIKHLQLARLSVLLCEMLRKEFFPLEEMEYVEFGYEDPIQR